jgi:hypothetical protein
MAGLITAQMGQVLLQTAAGRAISFADPFRHTTVAYILTLGVLPEFRRMVSARAWSACVHL